MTSGRKSVSGDVDGNVSAQLSQSATFLFAAGGRDDFRTEMFGDLDRSVADAAATPLDQQPLAGFEVAVRQQAEPRGEKYGGSCRRLGRGDSVGNGPDFGSLGDGVFGVATETRIRNDTLACLVLVDASAQLFDCAGEFATRNKRERIGGNTVSTFA